MEVYEPYAFSMFYGAFHHPNYVEYDVILKAHEILCAFSVITLFFLFCIHICYSKLQRGCKGPRMRNLMNENFRIRPILVVVCFAI